MVEKKRFMVVVVGIKSGCGARFLALDNHHAARCIDSGSHIFIFI